MYNICECCTVVRKAWIWREISFVKWMHDTYYMLCTSREIDNNNSVDFSSFQVEFKSVSAKPIMTEWGVDSKERSDHLITPASHQSRQKAFWINLRAISQPFCDFDVDEPGSDWIGWMGCDLPPSRIYSYVQQYLVPGTRCYVTSGIVYIRYFLEDIQQQATYVRVRADFTPVLLFWLYFPFKDKTSIRKWQKTKINY